MPMSSYYCHICARDNNLVNPVDPNGLTTTAYQLEKFIKHTAPSGIYPVNSIFHSSDWSTYEEYMVTTTTSGCLQIDEGGRKNLIWFAGVETGLQYRDGIFSSACSGITVVCSENDGKIHAFGNGFVPKSHLCMSCGKAVPY